MGRYSSCGRSLHPPGPCCHPANPTPAPNPRARKEATPSKLTIDKRVRRLLPIRPHGRQLSNSGQRYPVTRPLQDTRRRRWGVNQVMDFGVDPPDLSFPSIESPEHPNDTSMNEESASKFYLEVWFHMRYHTNSSWGRSWICVGSYWRGRMAKAYQVRQLLLALEELGIL
jgi:hypothetical protein